MISHQAASELIETPAAALGDLLARAGELRDRGRGKTVTFSAKVFVQLTTLCRDYCGYCTFRRDPGEPGAHTMTPDEVVASGTYAAIREHTHTHGHLRHDHEPHAAHAAHPEIYKRGNPD